MYGGGGINLILIRRVVLNAPTVELIKVLKSPDGREGSWIGVRYFFSGKFDFCNLCPFCIHRFSYSCINMRKLLINLEKIVSSSIRNISGTAKSKFCWQWFNNHKKNLYMVTMEKAGFNLVEAVMKDATEYLKILKNLRNNKIYLWNFKKNFEIFLRNC